MEKRLLSLEDVASLFFDTIARGINFHCNVIDRNYRIVWHNRVADEQRTGGRLCHEFYQERNAPCDVCPVRRVFHSGRPCIMERERKQKLPDGRPRWAEIRAYPLLGKSGGMESAVTIGFDITERKLALERQEELIGTLRKGIEQLSRKPIEASASFPGNPFPLTGRQAQVLALIAEGLSNNEIAGILSLSPHTVKSHLIHIFNKLGVSDRTEAAIVAARMKLI